MVDRNEFIARKAEFAELYSICFNCEMTTSEIEWRYLSNPYCHILACFAYDDDKLIANYSVSPIRLMVDGIEKKAVQSLNTMTHPDYIGRGLFVTLAKCVYKKAAMNGYIGVFGFPNGVSNRTFIEKLGWKDIELLPMIRIKTNDIIYINKITKNISYDNGFNLNYSRCRQKGRIYFKKSVQYLRWRYTQHPSNDYNTITISDDGFVKSYMIYKMYKNAVNIVDFCCSDTLDFSNLISFILNYSTDNDVEAVTLWAKLGSPEHLYCEKIGCTLATPITYFGGSVFDCSDNEITNPYYQANNWNVYLCDDNVF